jgi:hypothetical protein
MCEYLSQIPEIKIIVVDNDSAYEPLLKWYEENPLGITIERLNQNYGNFVIFSAQTAIEGHIKPDFLTKYREGKEDYIVTDSDLDLSGVPLDFLDVLKEGRRKYEWTAKVGLSLEISDLPNTDIAREALGWETMNWHGKYGDGFIKAPVDTTFALTRGDGEPNDFDKCIRTDRPYTAKHAPWYYTKDNLPEDEKFFYSRITNAFSHYSYRNKIAFGL